MAITGINLTALVKRLLQGNALKMHFYNTIRGTPTIDNFHHVFCMLSKVCHYLHYLNLKELNYMVVICMLTRLYIHEKMTSGQVFKLFCAFWTRRKPELISFNKIKDDFEAQLMVQLHSEEANLDKLDVRSFA